jgi:hypothetical protein
MKQLLLLAAFTCCAVTVQAQTRQKGALPGQLPDLYKSILQTQGRAELFTQNLDNNSREKDVNFIVIEMEKLIDSIPRNKTQEQVLLIKHFDFLRNYFLTATNKTTVATGFLYDDAPYRFCLYNDTALALYIKAVKNGDLYNLSKTTEKKISGLALENCLLPSLKPFTEFKDNDIKYVALSVYFGCKDTRDGAPNIPAVPYCLTMVARLADVQQFEAGLITAKGLLANAELYLGDTGDTAFLKKIQLNLE